MKICHCYLFLKIHFEKKTLTDVVYYLNDIEWLGIALFSIDWYGIVFRIHLIIMTSNDFSLVCLVNLNSCNVKAKIMNHNQFRNKKK